MACFCADVPLRTYSLSPMTEGTAAATTTTVQCPIIQGRVQQLTGLAGLSNDPAYVKHSTKWQRLFDNRFRTTSVT